MDINSMLKKLDETTLGKTLKASLDEMLAKGLLNQDLCKKIVTHFEIHLLNQLSTCSPKISIVSSLESVTETKEIEKVMDVFLEDCVVKISPGESCSDGDRDNLVVEVAQLRFAMFPAVSSKKRSLVEGKYENESENEEESD